ncbi:MAG: hypothetical protein ACE149_05325 [Armatimonadota bacterium]
MFSDVTGGLVAYYTGIAVVALPGLIGVILIGRMHRSALRDCRKLQDEVAKAEEATGRVRSLLSDLVATMNMTLAVCAANPANADQSQIDRIRAAAEEAIRAHQPAPSS